MCVLAVALRRVVRNHGEDLLERAFEHPVVGLDDHRLLHALTSVCHHIIAVNVDPSNTRAAERQSTGTILIKPKSFLKLDP